MIIQDLEALRAHRPVIERLARRHGIKNIRVFGSVARGQAGPGSDLDLLVELRPGSRLLDLVGFEQDLTEELGLKVQAFTEGALHRVFKSRVLAEAVPV